MKTLSGHIVDVVNRQIIKGHLHIEGNRIVKIQPSEEVEDQFIVPGFVDAHIHIESSMMTPSEFAKQVLPKGTIGCVCDPHEIANVCGITGIDFMIEDSKNAPLIFSFGAPSCVPATHAETSGASLKADDIKNLLQRNDIGFLGEMMNFPGVINHDEQVLLKIKAAIECGKPIDGHAPELSGDDLRTYVDEGISTDHECMTLSESKEKIALGMKILIREGSAARNLETLAPLITLFPNKVMLCTDDKHPDDLIQNGHMDGMIRKLIDAGYDVFDILQAASYNPINHYKLPIGLLQENDQADFLVVSDLTSFKIKETWIKGEKVAENGQICYASQTTGKTVNHFKTNPIHPSDIQVVSNGRFMRIICVEDGQLYTKSEWIEPLVQKQLVQTDIESDILKLVVYNRYTPSKPAVAFVKNFGLKKGALASTIAHDSHNIIAIGSSDKDICQSINHLIETKGGIIASSGKKVNMLPLPIAGLMSNESGDYIASKYHEVEASAKKMGCTFKAPFMTLAFLSLLVIPEIKLSDKGLFDVQRFSFTDLFSDTTD